MDDRNIAGLLSTGDSSNAGLLSGDSIVRLLSTENSNRVTVLSTDNSKVTVLKMVVIQACYLLKITTCYLVISRSPCYLKISSSLLKRTNKSVICWWKQQCMKIAWSTLSSTEDNLSFIMLSTREQMVHWLHAKHWMWNTDWMQLFTHKSWASYTGCFKWETAKWFSAWSIMQCLCNPAYFHDKFFWGCFQVFGCVKTPIVH